MAHIDPQQEFETKSTEPTKSQEGLSIDVLQQALHTVRMHKAEEAKVAEESIKAGKNRNRILTNVGLTAALLLSLYLIFAPIVPALDYYFRSLTGRQYENRAGDDGGERSTDSEEYSLGLEGRRGESDYFKDDIVVIPSIGVDMDVIEGKSEKALDKGVWIRPTASTPNRGSNTVLTAHRFSYLDGGRSFYHLDKLKSGDEVILYWKGDRYRYIVRDAKVVKPSAVEVEAPTQSPLLTLYTCTPLWTAANRLVITAVPDESTVNLIAKRASR